MTRDKGDVYCPECGSWFRLDDEKGKIYGSHSDLCPRVEKIKEART